MIFIWLISATIADVTAGGRGRAGWGGGGDLYGVQRTNDLPSPILFLVR